MSVYILIASVGYAYLRERAASSVVSGLFHGTTEATPSYWKLGDYVGKAWSIGRGYDKGGRSGSQEIRELAPTRGSERRPDQEHA